MICSNSLKQCCFLLLRQDNKIFMSEQTDETSPNRETGMSDSVETAGKKVEALEDWLEPKKERFDPSSLTIESLISRPVEGNYFYTFLYFQFCYGFFFTYVSLMINKNCLSNSSISCLKRV